MNERTDGNRVQLSAEWVGITEALAWIMTRDAELSASMRDGEPNKSSVKLAFWRGSPTSVGRSFWLTRGDAEIELLRCLKRGEVRAVGRSQSPLESAAQEIPARAWSLLKLGERNDHYVAVPSDYQSDEEYELWHRLLVDARELTDRFPRSHATLQQKQEAEDQATRLSMDPQTEARWSIPMALAWIATRSFDDVREQWDEYRHELNMRPTTFDDVVLACAYNAAELGVEPQVPVAEAWRQLRRALEAERLVARGVAEATGQGGLLDASIWRGMKASAGAAGMICLPVAGAGFFGVTVPVSDMLALWPKASLKEQHTNLLELQHVKKVGPRPKYDWPRFQKEVFRKLDDEGCLAPINGSNFTQARLEEHMATWCGGEWESVPSESTIRRYAVSAIGAWEAEKARISSAS